MESARAARLDQVMHLHSDDFKDWQNNRAVEIMRTAPADMSPADMIIRLMTMVPMSREEVFTFIMKTLGSQGVTMKQSASP